MPERIERSCNRDRTSQRMSRRWPLHVVAIAMACCGAAGVSLAPAAPPVADAPLAPTPPKPAKPPATSLSTDDLRFVDEAQMTTHLEISAGEMALEVSRDPKIHAFARQMVEDHKEALGALRGIAADKGITPQDRVPEAPELTRLKSLKADEFDQAYIRTIGIDAHEQAVLLFQNQSTRGKDPALRAFASRLLPALREHLKQARAMDQRVTAGR
ncbi:DUF4142 domain-containing protein [Cupriavidus pauculus]|uniref:DUF4142 domain-containing protein n=1 Tax=Cupriavidus pauculus TaxID=82633 RepID=A0A2N5CEH9_9BURK|nr:DUF4142 domain-containing protein [Cupriavidus pauculus]PLQ00582.1 hypothetical protein CYJ10_08900 [Cupriavidus pauculus]